MPNTLQPTDTNRGKFQLSSFVSFPLATTLAIASTIITIKSIPVSCKQNCVDHDVLHRDVLASLVEKVFGKGIVGLAITQSGKSPSGGDITVVNLGTNIPLVVVVAHQDVPWNLEGVFSVDL